MKKVLISIVAFLHLAFAYLEIFLWTKPIGLKVFKMTLQDAGSSALLASNQGMYNALLAVGLISSFFLKNSKLLTCYILSFIIIVGIYGGITVSHRIILVQSLPALVALAFMWTTRTPISK